VIDDAKRYLATLEHEQAASAARQPQQTLELFTAGETSDAASEICSRLAEIDVDALTPREALALLYELTERIDQG
jgi:DNA mismatch repair protein MutS